MTERNLKHSQAGYSLIEAIASMALVTASIVAALALTSRRLDVTSDASDQLSLVLARNEIIGHLQRNNTWNFELVGASDLSFDCIRKLNSALSTDRNCASAQPKPFNIYDNRGQMVFNGTNPNAGFTASGEPCNTFVPAGSGAGDPTCPIGLTLTWMPVCPTALCEDPVVEMKGHFQFNGGKRLIASDLAKNDFTIRRTHMYCPPTAFNPSLTNVVSTTVTSNSVVSTQPGGAGLNSVATFNESVETCQRTEVFFSDSMNAGATMPLNIPNNMSSVCLATGNTYSTCVFEYLRVYNNATASSTFKLRLNGADVYTKPAALAYTNANILHFRINQGLVRFCIDTSCVYTFDQKATGPLNLLFLPASLGFSTSGFTNISIKRF